MTTSSLKRPRGRGSGDSDSDSHHQQQQQHQHQQKPHHDQHQLQHHRRKLTSESNRNTPILCSPIYTDIHVVTFTYTIDTPPQNNSNDSTESIEYPMRQFERLSASLLAENLLHCDDHRSLESSHVNDNDNDAIDMSHDRSFLQTILSRHDKNPSKFGDYKSRILDGAHLDLGLVGFSPWPNDEISTQSQCFPSKNKSDICTVVNGKISVYLNPNNLNESEISSQQKESVEDVVRYEMMTLMRNRVFDNNIDTLEHVRYLSPMVVLGDEYNNYFGALASSQSPQANNDQSVSGLTVTQSILIIACCVAVIGAAGLILTFRVLFRKDDEFYLHSPRNSSSRRGGDDDSMNPQWAKKKGKGGARRNKKEQVMMSDKIHQQTEAGDVSASLDELEDFQTGMGNSNYGGRRGSGPVDVDDLSEYQIDPSSLASLPTTMRRAIITKKTPAASSRKNIAQGNNIALDSIVEDDECSQAGLQLVTSSPRSIN